MLFRRLHSINSNILSLWRWTHSSGKFNIIESDIDVTSEQFKVHIVSLNSPIRQKNLSSYRNTVDQMTKVVETIIKGAML